MDYQPDKEIEFKRDPEEDQLDEDNLSKTTLKIPADADLSGGVLDLQHAYKALVYLMHAAHSGVTFHGDDEPAIYGCDLWYKGEIFLPKTFPTSRMGGIQCPY
jgi:hypothetical protein